MMRWKIKSTKNKDFQSEMKKPLCKKVKEILFIGNGSCRETMRKSL